MIKTVMGALAATLVSGVAFAAGTEAKFDREEAQLDADHQQLQKVDSKALPNEGQKAPEGNAKQAGPAQKQSPLMGHFKEMSMNKGAHDAAKADANMADSAGSIGTGASDPKTIKVPKGEHDAAKADANMADSAGSIGTGASDPKTLKVAKSPHNAAASDSNMADASGSLGTGTSTHTLKNAVMLGGGQRTDGRSDSTRHEGVHGGGSHDHFGGGAQGNGGHAGGACHHGGGQGC
jgi:hypothetical protein